LGGRWVPRRQFSLSKLRRRYTEDEIMLLTEQEIRYFSADHHLPLFFHPSTAAIRIKRMLKGEADSLISIAGLTEGDTVLDCTAGLASDSILFYYAVGVSGKVTALESTRTLVMLLQEGLTHYESDIAAINSAMRRITIIHAEYLAYLQGMPAGSVDVIYFDPMFRLPIVESSAISPLRDIANAEALSVEAIAEAKRVARKKVIFKEHKDSKEFARLDFAKVFRSQTNIAYGVIEL
jgi:16S rRNA (guanine1516-N2)-methyltransferase